jgi:hypothetical protein
VDGTFGIRTIWEANFDEAFGVGHVGKAKC